MGLYDRTATLMRTGYRFSGWLRARTSGPERATALRLLGRRSLVVSGREGVELFYDNDRVRRRSATPGSVARTIFGRDAVHTLDDAAHRHRKQLFLEVTGPELEADLADRVAAKWSRELDRWVRRGTGTVLPGAVGVFGEAVQEWAGAGDSPEVMDRRSRDLGRIVDGFATPSPAWLRAKWARRRANGWAAQVISDVRQGRRRPGDRTAASVMAHARDLDGNLLPVRTAAVELLNVLRPTVAVAYFAAFAALELEANPDLADRCATGDPVAVEKFCQEVRRMSPFVPLLAGRSRCPFTWRGHEVGEGDQLFLDVYGTDTDPAAWADASTFDPDRFASGAAERDDFIPQGGGRVETGHRCPGEGIAMALLRTVVPSLARLDWSIHPDDRVYSLRRVPARPNGGVRLLDVRRHLLLQPV
jgi:fatty-acid peroxygenase